MIEGYKLVLDASYYQRFDYKLVSEQVDAVILRAAFGSWKDPWFDRHYDEFKSLGKPVAAYAWFRPDESVTKQIEVLLEAFRGKDIKVVLIDKEQATPYGVPVPIYAPDKLLALGIQMIEGMFLHGYDMGVYSARWWIDRYCPDLSGLYDKYIGWLASYPYDKKEVVLSWEDLKTNWIPKRFLPSRPAKMTDQQYSNVSMWQFTGDKFVLPGITNSQGKPRSTDLNLVTEETVARFTGNIPVPQPDPEVAALLEQLYDNLSALKGMTEAELVRIMRMIRADGG